MIWNEKRAVSFATIPGLRRTAQVRRERNRPPRPECEIQEEGRTLTNRQKDKIISDLLKFPRLSYRLYEDD